MNNISNQDKNKKIVNPKAVAKQRIRLAELAAIIICILFCTVFSVKYLIGPEINNDNKVTKRTITYDAIKDYVVEGDIIDRLGNLIIGDASAGMSATASYPENFSYAYLLGYYSVNSGYENIYGLRGNLANYSLFTLDSSNKGATVTLTTDSGLQNYAFSSILAGREGSVIVMDNETGAILALASQSTIEYDVNDVNAFLTTTVDGAQFRRGTYENDPPGSTFKVVTAAAALEKAENENLGDDYFDYYDDGTFIAEGSEWTITNYGDIAYGDLNLESALNNSVNCYFANLGTKIGADALSSMASKFMLGKQIEIPFLCTLNSSFEIDKNDADTIAQASYGQGAIEITPTHLCLIAQAIANNGVMMSPYIVDNIKTGSIPLYKHFQSKLSTCFDETVDNKLKTIMHSTAEGYGLNEEYYGMVYAKTGTAECSDDRIHKYIIGFTDRYSFCISLNNSYSESLLYEETQMLVNYLNNYMN